MFLVNVATSMPWTVVPVPRRWRMTTKWSCMMIWKWEEAEPWMACRLTAASYVSWIFCGLFWLKILLRVRAYLQLKRGRQRMIS